jgi:hypothetical protein
MSSPRTYKELFEFYRDTVKPLYSEIQLTNTLPTEILFEINAAFDHLSRAWTYGETEPAVVEKAYSHLKRSVLDIFKIVLRTSIAQYEELTKTDISIIDNGKFEVELRKLHHEIKASARAARSGEGDTRSDDAAAVAAFDLWAPVYEKCKRLEREFYESEKWLWAKQRNDRSWLRQQKWGLITGVAASLVAAAIWWAGAHLLGDSGRRAHSAPVARASEPSGPSIKSGLDPATLSSPHGGIDKTPATDSTK